MNIQPLRGWGLQTKNRRASEKIVKIPKLTAMGFLQLGTYNLQLTKISDQSILISVNQCVSLFLFSEKVKWKQYIKTSDGQIHKKKPTSWIKDKQVVGTSKAKKVIPENNPKHRWNKSSSPNNMPVSHPLGNKHQLKQLIFYKPNAGRNGLLIYADPWRLNANFKRDGWDGSEMDMSVLEAGGSYRWSRRYTAGYFAETIRYGASVHQGDGKLFYGKKDKNSEALKVGKTIDKQTGKLRVLQRGGTLRNQSVFRKLYSWKKERQPCSRDRFYDWESGRLSVISGRSYGRTCVRWKLRQLICCNNP